jgi:hypothetical protein
LQNIILLCTGTNKHGGYFAPPGVFLAIYIALCFIWAVLNTFALNVIAVIDMVSIYWQVSIQLLTLSFSFFYRFLLNTISYAFRIYDTSCAFDS